MDLWEFVQHNWPVVLLFLVLACVFVWLLRRRGRLAAAVAVAILVWLLLLARFGLGPGGGGGGGAASGGGGGNGGLGGQPGGTGSGTRPVLVVEVIRIADGNFRLRIDGAGEVSPIPLTPSTRVEQKLEQFLQEKKISPQQMEVRLVLPPAWPGESRRILEDFFRNRGFDVSVRVSS